MDHKVNRVLSVTGSWVLKGDTSGFSSVTFYIAYPLVAVTHKSVLFYLLLATIIRPIMGNFMINIVRVVESHGWNLCCFPGLLQYSHEKGEKGGSLSFKFNLLDPEGNKLIDQSFFISVLGRVPSVLRYPQHSNQGFHSVERKELLLIYPFVLHADWVTLHLRYVQNMNCVEPPSAQCYF